jgi:zinc transporter ZupT
MAALPLGAVLSVFVGLSNLAGSAAVLTGGRLLGRWIDYLLAFGSGFALAIVVGELIPASLSAGPQNAFWVLGGFSTSTSSTGG